MQWIKEVELVDSVDELTSSSSTRGISMPNFEVLDARIASALNKIIDNSKYQRRISREEQKGPERGPFLSRQTDCLFDPRSILSKILPTCSLLFFEMTTFRNSSGTEFYCL